MVSKVEVTSRIVAPKRDCLEAVMWEGMDASYPSWFEDFIQEGYISEDFGGDFYWSADGDGPYQVYEGDWFLRNKDGLVRYMVGQAFDDLLYVVE